MADAATTAVGGATTKDGSRRFYELPILVVVAVVIAILINTYLAQVFYIPSASMVPQLHVNDRVVVSKLAYHLHAPRRGDIVVFSAPPQEQGAHAGSSNPIGRTFQAIGRALGVSESKTELIKRVIGLPGDTVQGRDGHVYVDGLQLTEPYLPPTAVTDDFGPVTVAAGHLWVMGDNRTNSSDSRVFGPIPVSSIVGRAIWRIWPLDHLSFL
ncbi:MAG: signal peptidase I [Acidimicrobiales bacterium]